jgi:hypothetical protein
VLKVRLDQKTFSDLLKIAENHDRGVEGLHPANDQGANQKSAKSACHKFYDRKYERANFINSMRVTH